MNFLAIEEKYVKYDKSIVERYWTKVFNAGSIDVHVTDPTGSIVRQWDRVFTTRVSIIYQEQKTFIRSEAGII